MSFGSNNKNNIKSKKFDNTSSLNIDKSNDYVRSKFWPTLDESEVTNYGNNFIFLYRVDRKSNFFALSFQYSGQFSDATNPTGFTIDWGDGTSENYVGSGSTGGSTYQKTYNWDDISDTTRFDVTFSTGTNLVNKTSHGLVNGDKIYFSEIVTTTSLTQDYEYYVINATTDTFQLSKTLNGTAETINANGIGYVLPYKIAKVIVNANVMKDINGTLSGIYHLLSFPKPNILTNTNYECNILDIISCLLFGLPGSNVTYVTSLPYLEKIVFKNTFSGGVITYAINITGTFTNCYNLQKIKYLGEPDKIYTHSQYTSNLFYNCYKLSNFPNIYIENDLNSTYSNANMFYNCYNMETMPKIVDYNNKNLMLTATTSMFQNCYSLLKIQKINTKYVTNFDNMLSNCRVIKKVYEFDLTNATSIATIFQNCYLLEEYSNLRCNANVSPQIFNNCYMLRKIGNINFPNYNGNLAGLFSNCAQLEEVGNVNLPLAIGTSNLFSGCNKLKKVGKIYAPLSNNTSGMFNGCFSLIKIESLTLGTLINTSSMFYNCYNLKNFPQVTFSTVSNVNVSNMYYSCYSLESIGDLNLIKSTNCDGLFQLCSSLKSVGQITLNPTTNFTAQNMFNSCSSLIRIPYLNLSYATNITGMFQNCFNLENIGDLNVNSARLTTIGSLFNNCYSLDSIGSINLSGVTTSGSFSGCYNLSKFGMFGMKYGFSLAESKLDKEELETIFNNLGSGIASPGNITLTNTYGAIDTNASYSKTGSAGAIGATTITNSNTSNIYVGSYITAGPTLTRTVNLTISTNTITVNGHGMPNGKMVSMTTTAGGLTNNVPYYVVNSTTNTFGLATTLNGTAITFTATITNTMRIYHKVTAVNTNVNYTIDTPLISALTTGTSVTFRALDVTPLYHRGFGLIG